MLYYSDGENEVNMSDSSFLKSSRLDSQSSETDLEGLLGEEEKGETRKKKNRQHKKKQWATILRDLDLRVMSKLVFSQILFTSILLLLDSTLY